MFRLQSRPSNLAAVVFAADLPLITTARATNRGGETPLAAHFETKLGLILLEDIHRGPHGEEVVFKEEQSPDGRSLWGLERELIYVESQGHKITVPKDSKPIWRRFRGRSGRSSRLMDRRPSAPLCMTSSTRPPGRASGTARSTLNGRAIVARKRRAS
jgi:hypothetical protein